MNEFHDFDELNIPLGTPAPPSENPLEAPVATADQAGRWDLPGPRTTNTTSEPRIARGRRRPTRTQGALTAGLLVAVSAGALVGHVAWQPGGSSTTTSIAAGSGNSGTGSIGRGSIGSGSIGSGSSGSGSIGSGSGSGSSSSASGAPADASALASGTDAGLVDINTGLSYEDGAAAGTGMVLTADGEVLTNNHVIDGATSISVTDVGNGKTYKARVVGYDRTSDVAVLQLEGASGLKTIDIGDASTLAVGQAVVGVGNAGGAGGTPSYAGGSVTALGQSITASDQSSGFSEKLKGLIQDNVDIQPGDSGGALVNSAGQVIGMNTAASATSGFGAYGVSGTEAFAIPINTALRIAKVIEAGTATNTVHIGSTAFLGVEVPPTSPTPSIGGFGGGFGALGGPGSSGTGSGTGTTTPGALISGLVSSGPAAQAGLVVGDTITALGGQAVSSASGLTNAILKEKAGQSVPLTYVDSTGATHTVTIRLRSGPPQ